MPDGIARLTTQNKFKPKFLPKSIFAGARGAGSDIMRVGAGEEVVSYSVTATAPSGGVWAAPAFITFNNARLRQSNTLTNSSGAGWSQINTATGGLGVTPFVVDVSVQGKYVCFQTQSYGDGDYKILINNKHLKQSEWEHFPNTTNVWYHLIEFRDDTHHDIRFFGGTMGFASLMCGTGTTAWPGPRRPRWLFTGDSYGQGAGGTTEGSIGAGSLPGEIAVQFGITPVNYCIGGTGHQNPGAGSGATKYGSATRLAAYAAATDIDCVVIIGGANDGAIGTYPVATSRTEANALWTALKGQRPTVPIIVMGIESGVYPSIAADLDTLNTGLKAEAAAHPELVDYYIDQRQGALDDWVYGTGKLNAQDGTGNADIFRSSDGVHPSHGGNKFVALLAGAELKANSM